MSKKEECKEDVEILESEDKEEKKEVKKELTIYDLPGVGAATAEKLSDAGYDNLMAIAVATPGELVESVGVGESVARKIINAARNNMDMGFETGIDLLRKREAVKIIGTGSKMFNDLIGGGFETGAITECYGPFGSGKSALAHQLAVSAQLPEDQGGVNGAVVWIDTESTFRPERIVQIAKAYGLDPMKTLGNIRCVRAFNSDHQMLVSEKVEDLIKDGIPVKLVIVDSLMAHFRAEFCVTPDMDVIGNPTVKKVTEFKEGNKVLTSNGRFSRVLSTNKIHYDGSIVKIRPAYFDAFTLTPDHTVLAVKTVRNTWYKNKSKFKTKDKINYLKTFKGKNHYKVFEGYGPDWIMAGTLEKGDYLAYPIIKETKDLDFIDIRDYIDVKKYKLENEKITVKGYHKKELYGEVIKEYNFNPIKGKITEISNKHNLPVSTVYQWINSEQKTREDIVELNLKVPVNKDSMRLFGYYLAEGHTNDHQVVFTFNTKEKEYIADVEKLMKNIFNVSVNKAYIEGNSYRVVFSHKVLAEFFVNLLGKRSENKSMPQWMLFLAKDKQKEIIKGHWRGDGATSRDGYRFDTVSRLLAEQIKQILLRLNILPCLRVDKNNRPQPKYVVEIFGKQLELFTKYLCLEEHKALSKRKYSYNNGWIDGDYAFIPIRQIEEMSYKGYVYNLEIEKDHSYALNSVVVHNCGRGTLAERQQKINKHMHVLKKLADVHELSVYVTNQVMAKPDTFFGDPTAAIGGNIVGHNSQTRIYLRRGKAGTRVAKLVDSPHLPDGEAIFTISDDGIRDVK